VRVLPAPLGRRARALTGLILGWLLACSSSQPPPRLASRTIQSPVLASEDRAPPRPAAPEAERAAPAREREPEQIDDSGEGEDADHEQFAEAEAYAPVGPHPLDSFSDEELETRVESDLASLGPMSVGLANAGSLVNGVLATETRYYKPVARANGWATQETLDYLQRALAKVHEAFPETPPLPLGDISAERGGPLRPHRSHQSGRDVDIAYFYLSGPRWYARGNAKNLDLPRNWAFVRALIAETDVEFILIDRSIQILLERHAREQGEDPEWLRSVFRGIPGRYRPIIRHARGHATHFHIRFFNPIAQESGRRCFEYLASERLIKPTAGYVTHRVKKNETLGKIAKKYGTTAARIRAANNLKSSLIREQRLLAIPVPKAGPRRAPERLRIPERRIPPPRIASARPRAEASFQTRARSGAQASLLPQAQPPPTR
jgi:penicillin-insensitive murein endopeptidase